MTIWQLSRRPACTPGVGLRCGRSACGTLSGVRKVVLRISGDARMTSLDAERTESPTKPQDQQLADWPRITLCASSSEKFGLSGMMSLVK